MQSCLTFGNSRILAETFEVVGHEGKVEKEEDEEAEEEEEEDESKVENVSWLLCQVYDANLPTLFEETWCKSTNPWNLTLLEMSFIVYNLCVTCWWQLSSPGPSRRLHSTSAKYTGNFVKMFLFNFIIWSFYSQLYRRSLKGSPVLSWDAQRLHSCISSYEECFNKMIIGIPDMLVSIPGMTMIVWQLKGSSDIYKLPFHYAEFLCSQKFIWFLLDWLKVFGIGF